jgi:hypothetical protein
VARGWESKDIESQVDSFERDRKKAGSKLTPEEIERQRKRESLQLSRTRVLTDISNSRHPQHRKMLEASLAHLDAKLAELD